MNRPRILQVGKFYPPYMGGIETHLEALCGQLRPSFDVQVLAANTSNVRLAEERDGVSVIRLPPRIWLSTAPVCPSLAREIRRARPDLVHLHLPHPGGILGVLGSGYRGPLVVTYHSDVVRQQWRAAPFHPLVLATLRRADAILATSEAYVRTSPVLQRFRSKCAVVPYGIPTERFAPSEPADRARLRERFGGRVVLAIGRLVYYKGYDVLVEAMQHVNGHLVLVGDGPLLGALRAQAARQGVAHKITFAGEIANEALGPYYQVADVFALSSIARSEAFGIVQLEALASGVPVVNTSLPSGVPEVSLDGVTGLTVPPGDARALAAALSRLLDDPQLRARYAAAGRQRIAEHYTNDRMGERVRRIYAGVLGTGRSREGREAAGNAAPTGPSREPALKRAFDVALSLAGITLSSPLWLAIAVALKAQDGGPIFYHQPRVGRFGRVFTALKFRSMIADAEAGVGAVQATRDDPRVTRIGGVLRGTALDELPQLVNILRGDMSFVGPRALRPDEIEQGAGTAVPLSAIPGYAERITVRPGLTGIAQIYAPRDVPRRSKFRYDRLYVRRRSFWLDLRLIALSFWISVRGAWEAPGSKW